MPPESVEQLLKFVFADLILHFVFMVGRIFQYLDLPLQIDFSSLLNFTLYSNS